MANVLSDRVLEELGRWRFHSSGRVDWSRMTPMILVGILGGVGIAVALTAIQYAGLYFIVLIPILAGLAMYYLVSWIVERGHCRSRLVAILVAVPIGLIAYLGQYQARLAYEWGWEGIYRIDMLPQVIWMNWETQVFENHGRPGQPGDLQFITNVIMFFVELLVMVVAGIVGAYQTAGRVYSDEHECWARSITRIVPEMWGAEIEPSVRANDLAELLAMIEVMPVPDPKHPPPRTIMTLEVFDADQLISAYLTVTHAPKWTTVIVRQLLLTREEYQACRPLFLS